MTTGTPVRCATVSRETRETVIALTLGLEGSGTGRVRSGNGFMDHMLTLFAKHGLFDLDLSCSGDTHIDFHHSAEDIGLCLGQAIDDALGARIGIVRFATAHAPMDESLARVCLDISGRPTLVFSVACIDRAIGDFDVDLVQDFFKALSDRARLTLHIDLLRGRNTHHSIEAVFKAFGMALGDASRINPRAPAEIPSVKGTITA